MHAAVTETLRKRPILKSVSTVVLVAFLSLTLQPLALAAQLPKAKPLPATSQTNAPAEGADLARTLENIEGNLAKLETKLRNRKAADTERASLKTLRETLETEDRATRADFDAVGQRLREKNLPPVIQNRHTAAVAQYQKEMTVLRGNLDAIEQATDESTRHARTGEALRQLKAKQKKRTHTPVDPNNLPFRMPDAKKTRKPAEKKEDFRKLGLQQDERIQLAATELLPGMLSVSALAAPPGPADLTATEDVQITPEIQALAVSLGNNPVKIYNWVHNNINFVPTYGSIQGSQMCLETKQCNAFDTASLLIALLRTAGVSARYVYGTVQIPIDKVMNWVGGVTKPEAAADLLGQGGIPNTAIVSGGKIVQVRLEHVWVEAWVDFYPSRGAIHKQGDTWVPMDASFKQYQFAPGMDIKNNVPFDAQSLLTQTQVGATINQSEGWVKNLNTTAVQTAFTNYQNQAKSYVDPIKQNASVGDLLGIQQVIEVNHTILPVSPPYTLITTGGRFAEIPIALRANIDLRLYASEIEKATENPDITFSVSQTALGNRRFTLSYDPASAADEQYLVLHMETISGPVPAYLVYVKPTIRLNGNIVAQGSPVSLGTEQTLSITVTSAAAVNKSMTATNKITAGSYAAFVTKGPAVSANKLLEIKGRLTDANTKRQLGQFEGLSKDDFTGEFLHTAGVVYWAYTDLINRLASSSHGVIQHSLRSFGTFSWDARITYYFGIPRTATAGGLSTDIDLLEVAAVTKDNKPHVVSNYMLTSGMIASYLEGTIWGHMLNSPQITSNAISAAHILELSVRNGTPIHTLDTSNVSTLAFVQAQPEVKQEINTALSAGRIVVIPQAEQKLGAWVGAGYVIFDPATGSGAYKISGGLNGGGFDCGCLNLPPEIEFIGAVVLAFAGLSKAASPAAFLAGLILAITSTVAALCQIDSAPGVTDEQKELLRGGLYTLLGIGLAAAVIGVNAGASIVAIGLYINIVTIVASAIITNFMLPIFQAINKKQTVFRNNKWVGLLRIT